MTSINWIKYKNVFWFLLTAELILLALSIAFGVIAEQVRKQTPQDEHTEQKYDMYAKAFKVSVGLLVAFVVLTYLFLR
jgi:NADH:ubiquinone oxidoreductase subunit K